MGLRCLLGHDYGDPELERDRDEQGEEVVVTIREVATCTRCGAERVVSENKEVTSIASPSEIEGLAADDAHDAEVVDADGVPVGSDDGTTTEPSVDAGQGSAGASADAGVADATGGTDGSAASPDADSAVAADRPETADAEILEETTDEAHTPTADEVAGTPATEDADDGPSAEEDDGVILDADDETPSERGHGEWPEADDVNDGPPEQTPTIEEVRGETAADAEGGETAADGESAGDEHHDAEVVSEADPDRAQWPEQVGDDEGFDAEPGDGSATDVEFAGLAPEGDSPEDVQNVEEGFDAEFVDNGADESRAANGTITRATEIDTSRDADDVPTEYVCPECGLRRPATGSSMREGDICPECKRGYIAEKPR